MTATEMPTVAEPTRKTGVARQRARKYVSPARRPAAALPPQAVAKAPSRPPERPKTVAKPRPVGTGQPPIPKAADRAPPPAPAPMSASPPSPPAPTVAPPPAPQLTQAQALDLVVQKANAGDPVYIAGLKKVLDARPEVWQTIGDVATQAEQAWINLTAGDNKLVEESIRRRLTALTADLTGEKATPLERLMVRHVGVTWLAANRAESEAAQPARDLPRAGFRLKQAESAQRRFNGAVRTLAVVRALLPG